MKTRIATYLLIISTCLLFNPFISIAQKTHNAIDKEFDWKDENKTETYYLDVKKKSNTLLMSFAGAIDEGSMEVTVFNPSGEKIPGFHLICEDNNKNGVSVSMSTGKDAKKTRSTTSTSSSGTSTSRVSTTTSKTSTSSNDTSGELSSGNSYEYSSTNSDSKGAKGVVTKVLSDPMPGKWKLVISVKDVTGKLDVEIDQE
jgi:hypothetical protein